MKQQNWISMLVCFCGMIVFSFAQQGDDNLLIVDLPYFRIEMDGFYEGEGSPGDDYNRFYENLRDVRDDVELNYLLWDFLGPFGNVFGEALSIHPYDTIQTIVSVSQQYTTTLFFNEDGSGGVWTINEIPELSSAWMEIEQIDRGTYQTFTEESLATTKPVMPEHALLKADDYAASREIMTTYDEYPVSSSIRILYSVAKDTFAVTLHFSFLYGD